MLLELANFFCSFGAEAREIAANVIHDILDDPSMETIPQTRQTLHAGLAFYETRLDKCYSLTDCISMNVMRERGIFDVFTNDKHFMQEGFNIQLP